MLGVLGDMCKVSQQVSLKINIDKTKAMSYVNVAPIPVDVRNDTLKVVDEYLYLGQMIRLGWSNLYKEVARLIQRSWAAF